MKTFTDNAGRKWHIEITFGLLMQIKRDLGTDVLGMVANDERRAKESTQTLTDLMVDIEQFVNVLFVTVAEQHDVSDVEFGKHLTGNAITEAYFAWFEALQDFFRQSPRTEAAETIKVQLGMIREAVKAAGEQISNSSYGQMPESPESTQWDTAGVT